MSYRTLDRFKKVNNVNELPATGTYIVLTRSTTFLGKAIQGFQRLWQWLRGDRDTDHIPNHADVVRDGEAIGALEKGVKKHLIKDHFKQKSGTSYFIINFTDKVNEEQLLAMWKFAIAQENEGYRYLDILKHAWQTIRGKWFGMDVPIDTDRWTCYWLVGQSINIGMNEVVFNDPRKMAPYEDCVVFDSRKDLFI